ncbi:MAG: PAS domain S-box protein [Treponema sp.]|nr:PAS domain S-box protein [Treponema sp.]
MKNEAGKTILLVEDEALIAAATARTLQRFGFAVRTAPTGERAVEVVETDPDIDLVLMDIDLGPGMDGAEAARRILRIRDIPLVFHSAHTEPEVVDKTEGIGSYGYIVKNSGDTVLEASIRMAFRLWESESRFRTAFESVAVGMVLTSPDGKLLRVNQEFCSMLGYTREELAFLDFAALTHPDDVEPSRARMAALRNGDSDRARFRKRYLHKDGRVVWADLSVVLLRDSSGEPQHFVTHVQDITEELRIREELERSRAQFDLLLRTAPVSILVLQDGRYVFANPFGARLLGYGSPEEMVRVSAIDTIAEEHRSVIRERMERVAAGLPNEPIEMYILRKDGTKLLSESTSIPIVYDGRPAALILGRDMTEQKRMEERLRAAESIAHVGHYDIDLATGSAVWSEETYRIFGLDPGTFQPTMENYAELIHEEDRDAVYQEVDRCIRTGDRFDKVYRIRTVSGEYRFVHSIGRVRKDGNGAPASMVGTFQDVTETVRVEQTLRESKERLDSILKAVPAGIGIVQGPERIIREANGKLCEMTGYSREELVGASIGLLYADPEEYERVGRDKYRQIAERGYGTAEAAWRTKDGRILEIFLASAPLFSGDLSRGVTFAALDITERKRAEEAVRTLLSEKELLLRETHHRVKNNMGLIHSLLSLQAGRQGNTPARGVLEDAAARVQGMSRLYDRLYRSENFREMSLRDFLPGIVDQVRTLFNTEVDVRTELRIEDIPLPVRTLTPLGILLNELVTNSMKYAFRGRPEGRILLTAARRRDKLRITYGDDGPGLPESIDPDTSGGFGLQLCRLLSEQLGGTLNLERGRETRFVLEFPVG